MPRPAPPSTARRHLVVWAAVLSLVASVAHGLDPQPAEAAAGLRVGVVFSDSTEAFARAVPAHDYAQGMDIAGRQRVAADWVTDAGHTLVRLSDADLASKSALSTVDVVILPYTIAMSEAASLNLRAWVKQGGGLVPILASPRVFLEDGQWKLWVRELNYEAWEWGPLSEAYQVMFVNDPTVSTWSASVRSGHPVTDGALADVGLSSATLRRPTGSGVEFSYTYNANTTPLLSFAGLPTSSSAFNGYPAAHAAQYGSGRVAYFSIPLLDFLPTYNASLAGLSVGGGRTQGQLASALLGSAVEWAANGGGFGPVSPSAVTWGEVDSYGSAIYVRQWVTAKGTAPVSGTLTTRIWDPAGRLVKEHRIANLGIEPGRTHQYSWSFLNGATLADGAYRVTLEYRYTYPDYQLTSVAQAFVSRAQGTSIKTQPVGASGGTSAPVVADAADEVFFYRTDGLHAYYQVGTTGALGTKLTSGTGYTKGWDQIEALDLDGDGTDELFFYRDDGLHAFYRVRPDGQLGTKLRSGFGYTKGWTQISALDLDGDGRDELMFYRDDGLHAFYKVGTTGALGTKLRSGFGYTTGWTQINGVDLDGDRRDELFFYRDDGLHAFYKVGTTGALGTKLRSGFGYTKGWTSITAIDLDGDHRDEMFYYRTDGLHAFYQTRPDGSLATKLRSGTGYTRNWTQITSLQLDTTR